ncbi:hypothetical protein D3C72_2247790 [compost metagenome]
MGRVIVANLTVVETSQTDCPGANMLSDRKFVAIFEAIFVIIGFISAADIHLKIR